MLFQILIVIDEEGERRPIGSGREGEGGSAAPRDIYNGKFKIIIIDEEGKRRVIETRKEGGGGGPC